MIRTPHRIRRSRIAIAGLAGLALAVVVAPVAEAAKAPPKGQVRVMTRNLYLGADLTPALTAPNQPALAVAGLAIQNTVDDTDFPRRAKLLAAEIKKKNPDLVGLQEVALWRNDTTAPAPDGPGTPAKDVRYDFLALLMAKLNKGKDGPDFRVVRTQREADVEIPLANGTDGRLTMHDVVLARKDSKVVTEHDFSQRFDNNLTQVVAGAIPVTFWRGWLAVDATVRGEEFRFINTHLEAFDADVREDQAEELVQGLPSNPNPGPANIAQSAGGPVVLLGDLNSDDDLVALGEGSADDEEPYAVLTAAGYEERSPDVAGTANDVFSCCYHTQTIDDPSDTFDHTVDHIMVSDDNPGVDDPDDIDLVNSEVLGENVGGAADTSDMTAPPRLWPSDHGGVVSTLQFPPAP